MRIVNKRCKTLLMTLVVIAAQMWAVNQPLAQTQPVSILIVRHAEADTSQPTVPLTAVGRQRAELLAQTLRGVKFTHIFQAIQHVLARWSKGLHRRMAFRSSSFLCPARSSMGNP